MEIEDKKETKNLVVDHLFRSGIYIVENEDEIKEVFLHEQLLAMQA